MWYPHGSVLQVGSGAVHYPDSAQVEAELVHVPSKCRTTDPQASYQLQEVLDIKKRFQYSEVYPSNKVRHFNQ